jgi:hypothetical protein
MIFMKATILAVPLFAIVLALPAAGDVLLNGKTPIDRGFGEMVGDEIRWTSCNDKRITIRHPPYSVYKRDKECDKLGVDSSTGGKLDELDPSVFGLTCSGGRGGFVIGQAESKECTVEDNKLAQLFLSSIRAGDRVTYKVNGTTITLTHGDEKLFVDSSKWGTIARSRGFY